ncbi:unnamed protein product [marine sediment metagenome]|uniref:Uncharacterized protein n=1 Tax=marine sediment metagenome TaxID=412755 RepID=X1IZH2_9ZZZZ
MRGSSAIATGNCESKNALIVFGLFLMLVILVTSIIIVPALKMAVGLSVRNDLMLSLSAR